MTDEQRSTAMGKARFNVAQRPEDDLGPADRQGHPHRLGQGRRRASRRSPSTWPPRWRPGASPSACSTPTSGASPCRACSASRVGSAGAAHDGPQADGADRAPHRRRRRARRVDGLPRRRRGDRPDVAGPHAQPRRPALPAGRRAGATTSTTCSSTCRRAPATCRWAWPSCMPRAEVIVVTTPARAAQKVAVRAVGMARKSYLRVAGVIENMSAFALRPRRDLRAVRRGRRRAAGRRRRRAAAGRGPARAGGRRGRRRRRRRWRSATARPPRRSGRSPTASSTRRCRPAEMAGCSARMLDAAVAALDARDAAPRLTRPRPGRPHRRAGAFGQRWRGQDARLDGAVVREVAAVAVGVEHHARPPARRPGRGRCRTTTPPTSPTSGPQAGHGLGQRRPRRRDRSSALVVGRHQVLEEHLDHGLAMSPGCCSTKSRLSWMRASIGTPRRARPADASNAAGAVMRHRPSGWSWAMPSSRRMAGSIGLAGGQPEALAHLVGGHDLGVVRATDWATAVLTNASAVGPALPGARSSSRRMAVSVSPWACRSRMASRRTRWSASYMATRPARRGGGQQPLGLVPADRPHGRARQLRDLVDRVLGRRRRTRSRSWRRSPTGRYGRGPAGELCDRSLPSVTSAVTPTSGRRPLAVEVVALGGALVGQLAQVGPHRCGGRWGAARSATSV